MANDYVVAVEGLSLALSDVKALPKNVIKAARLAVNRTVTTTRTRSAREMRQQVNFPARYLTGSTGRLKVTKRASAGDLEAVITGRARPTSLARFVTGRLRPGRGARVEVEPGAPRVMRRAFLIRLRQGNVLTDTRFNAGLAIRLKPGETILNKKRVIQVTRGLYVLYGPSVDQVFRTVSEDVAPGAEEFLEAEFLRLLEVF